MSRDTGYTGGAGAGAMRDEDKEAGDAGTEGLLAERGRTHGEYSDNARTTWEMMRSLQSLPGYRGAPPEVLHAAYMVVHKLSRAFGGDLLHEDHWADIIGYSQLVRDRLPRLRERATTTGEAVPLDHSVRTVVKLELDSGDVEQRISDLAARATELNRLLEGHADTSLRAAPDVDIYDHMALVWGVEREEARQRVHAYMVRLHEAPTVEEVTLLEKLRQSGLEDLTLEEAEDVLRARERARAQATMAEETRDKSAHRTGKIGPGGEDLPLAVGDPVYVRGIPQQGTVDEVNDDTILVRWPMSVRLLQGHHGTWLRTSADAVVYARHASSVPDQRLVPRHDKYRYEVTWKQYEDMRGREVQTGSMAGGMAWYLYEVLGAGADTPDVYARLREQYKKEYGQ